MDEKLFEALAAVLTGVGTVFLAGAAIYAACVGLRQYKARTIADLSDRFYQREDYKEVYLAFDDCDPEMLTKIEKVLDAKEGDPPDRDTEWKLARYLNFFEIAANLAERGELGTDDLLLAFEWPLRCLAKQARMDHYLAWNGYERLATAIKRRAAGAKKTSTSPNDRPKK